MNFDEKLNRTREQKKTSRQTFYQLYWVSLTEKTTFLILIVYIKSKHCLYVECAYTRLIGKVN